jgi:uncharacterized protein DUF4240
MDIQKFWSMIEAAQNRKDGVAELQHNFLIEELSLLSTEEIQEFDHIFWHMHAQAKRANLWEAVYVIACGCGDDAFDDFRNWLIAQGQAVYENVLDNPENLAEIVTKEQRFDLFDIHICDVTRIAYKQKTGQPIPEFGYQEKPVLIGGPLIPAVERPRKFPRIVEKIGECGEEELSS